ncbi:MAG: hypothetical protein QM692_03210 [Thermomicrobiales bacterium]
MDSVTFDAITRALSRRSLAAAVIGVAAGASALATPDASARKRRVRGEHNVRGNKAIMCINGETKRVAKSKRKKWLKKGATRGECQANPVCTPVCTSCNGGSDGCGGTCPVCTASQVCVNGACKACNLTCDDTPIACGDALDTALAAGGDIYLCPGLYEGTFSVDTNVNIYGAGGDTEDPAISTILEVQPGDITQVMVIRGKDLTSVLISGVRVTGGNNGGFGGGIEIDMDGEVIIENSVINKNRAWETVGLGGGIGLRAGNVTIRNSEISENEGYHGGGLYNDGATLTIIDTTIRDNSAYENGGGLFNDAGTTSLATTVAITENDAATGGSGAGGGIYQGGGTVNVNGATVNLNTPDQCSGVVC